MGVKMSIDRSDPHPGLPPFRGKGKIPAPKAVIFDWDNTLVNTWPVIHDAPGPARKRAALAMSSGSPRRRKGSPAATSSPAGSHNARAKSVRTSPGAMAFTRTPGPSSTARMRVRWTIAALVVL